ncbi:WD repeat-containing protein 61 [Galemys pyrenaicus]|uniref:Superkiller complex protein 8 n=1 Tax=Galemys pyrenaicus TaxID=202257 RepID=A0A8J6ACT4_GALPY|nr:WD repeat-containing protein 61 [Galemys pyrenaicus]
MTTDKSDVKILLGTPCFAWTVATADSGEDNVSRAEANPEYKPRPAPPPPCPPARAPPRPPGPRPASLLIAARRSRAGDVRAAAGRTAAVSVGGASGAAAPRVGPGPRCGRRGVRAGGLSRPGRLAPSVGGVGAGAPSEGVPSGPCGRELRAPTGAARGRGRFAGKPTRKRGGRPRVGGRRREWRPRAARAPGSDVALGPTPRAPRLLREAAVDAPAGRAHALVREPASCQTPRALRGGLSLFLNLFLELGARLSWRRQHHGTQPGFAASSPQYSILFKQEQGKRPLAQSHAWRAVARVSTVPSPDQTRCSPARSNNRRKRKRKQEPAQSAGRGALPKEARPLLPAPGSGADSKSAASESRLWGGRRGPTSGQRAPDLRGGRWSTHRVETVQGAGKWCWARRRGRGRWAYWVCGEEPVPGALQRMPGSCESEQKRASSLPAGSSCCEWAGRAHCPHGAPAGSMQTRPKAHSAPERLTVASCRASEPPAPCLREDGRPRTAETVEFDAQGGVSLAGPTASILAHDDAIWSVAWGASRKESAETVVTGSLDDLVKVWKWCDERLDLQWSLEGHQLGVVSVDVSHTLPVAASSSLDAHIRLWDLENGKQIKCIDAGPVDAWTLAFSPDSQYLATGTHVGKVNIFGVESGKKEYSLDTRGKFILSIAYSPDGKYLASGAIDGIINIFDIATGKLLHTLEGHAMPIRSLTFSPDSQLLVTASDDGYIKIYDVQHASLAGTLSGHASWVLSVAFCPDDTHFVSSSSDKSVKVWDVGTRTCVHTFFDHQDQVWGVKYSGNGSKIVSVGDDQEIHVYDCPT